MGLSIGDVRWSYSGFHRFRSRLAREIGINLNAMAGFGGDKPWSTIEDAIVPLLNHSDCDGHLSPSTCAQVAPRLHELVSRWPDIGDDGREDYDKQNALQLVESMKKCAKAKRKLEFR